MEGVKILTEINPKLSLLISDVTINLQIVNELIKKIPKNFIFESKVNL